MHAAAGVDRLSPVVRHVVHEAADQRVRDEATGGDAAFDDLSDAGRLSEAWTGGVRADRLTGTKTVLGSCALTASPASSRTTSRLGRISAS